MRVLHAVHNYPPEFRGGIERAVELLVSGQIAAGCTVGILCGSESERPLAELSAERDARPAVFRLVRGPRRRDPIDVFRPDLAPLIEEALERFRPDVLHVHHSFNLSDDLVRRAARRGIPAVVTLHDFHGTCALFFRLPDGETPCDLLQSPDACAPCIGARFGGDDVDVRARVRFRSQALEAELRSAAAVLVPSEAHRRALMPHLPAGVEPEVVPLGSPPAVPDPRRPRTGPLRVLHFGNLCRLKGVEFLARAVRAADPAGESIRLTLAGKRVEADLDLRGAVLAGAYEAAGLPALAADADLACFPSFARESYSLVVDEALRLGLPVLVSDRGALAERIGTRGRALAAGDERSWAAALRELAADAGALRQLAEGQAAPLIDPADQAARVLRVYDRVRTHVPPAPDLQSPLLARLAYQDGRIDEVIRLLASPGTTKGPDS